jgi:Domain of Unknown Function (DUF1206)
MVSTRTATHMHSAAARSLGGSVARAGLVARGVIYLLIGWVALMLAIGHSNQELDQRGALQTLAGKHYGSTALWALVVGFAAYALWRFSEAIWGVTGEGNGAGPRIKSAVRGVVYAFFALTTVSVLHGSDSSQAASQQDVTARVMKHSGGRWVIGVVGAIVLIVGLTLILEGLRRKFLKTLRTDEMSHRTRSVVVALGTVGTTARGIIFALAGWLVIDAAKTFNPVKARGLDEALRTLRSESYGAALLGLAALGLIVFGLYGLCEARWRRV